MPRFGKTNVIRNFQSYFFIHLSSRKKDESERNEFRIRNLELGAMQALLLNFEV